MLHNASRKVDKLSNANYLVSNKQLSIPIFDYYLSLRLDGNSYSMCLITFKKLAIKLDLSKGVVLGNPKRLKISVPVDSKEKISLNQSEVISVKSSTPNQKIKTFLFLK